MTQLVAGGRGIVGSAIASLGDLYRANQFFREHTPPSVWPSRMQL
jgi:hypothetical protein